MQEIFKRIPELIKSHKADKLAGRFNSIPVPFKRLKKVFPGWERGTYTIVTANSGVGKTKMTKFLIITSILKFVQDHPDVNVRIRWYALEESEEEFGLSFVSTVLQLKWGIRLSTSELKSLGEHTISEDHVKKIELAVEYLKDFMKNVTIVDNIYNPYGIWKDVREDAAKHGQFYFTGTIKGKDGQQDQVIKDKKVAPGGMWSHYVPNDPRQFVFVVTDHIGLLSPERGQSKQEVIGHYSQHYCLELMRKKMNYHVVNVQQQNAVSEAMQWTQHGRKIEEKVEPTLDGLANNKETQRDADLILGYFSPMRYDIANYRGYDVKKLQNFFRVIIFLKDRRYGTGNSRAYFFFDGATNVLQELPKVEEMTEEVYKKFVK